MTEGTRRTMGGADAMWLHMDRPNHLMVIDGIMWTEEPLDWTRVEELLQERLVGCFPVFRQRPVETTRPWELPAWEDDPDFALDRHVHRAKLRAPGGEAQLRAFLEKRVTRPLDRSRPLWEAWLVDGYQGGSVVFTRCHHAMADGMALAQVMLTITDPAPDGHDPEAPAPVLRHDNPLTAGARWLVRSALTVPALPVIGYQTVRVAQKLLLGVLPRTVFTAEPSTDKRLAWSRARSVDDIKRVSKATGTTVNDVLVAALSGALARFLADHGESVDHLTTMVPVNTRPADQPLPAELGNRFALVLLDLPTAEMGVRERLDEVHLRMGLIKSSPETVITSVVAEGIGHLHPIDRPLVDFFAGKAVGVTTNVIGPREPRYLAGKRVVGTLGWVPGSGGQTLGVCIYSYDNTVRIGFKVDAASVPEPSLLIDAFDAELDALGALVPER